MSPKPVWVLDTNVVVSGVLHPDRAAGQLLSQAVAGHFLPAYDARILRGVTWPRMKLRYALKENGRVVLSAEEAIADLNYLSSPTFYGPSDSLRYEKRMLDDWFRARIVERRPPPG